MLKLALTCDVCGNSARELRKLRLMDSNKPVLIVHEVCEDCHATAHRLLTEWVESSGAACNLGL